jgi:hypothetical protein
MDPDDVSVDQVAAGESTDVTYISLNKPVWVYGLRNATWLLPTHDPRAKLIAFTPLACPAANAGPQPEDDRGRFARAIPLFLSESFWFRCGLRPVAMIPAVKGSGPAMLDKEMSEDEVWDLGGAGVGYVVTGTLTEDGLSVELALTLYDAQKKQKVQRFSRSGPRFQLGAMALELDDELRGIFGAEGAPPDTWYLAPDAGLIDGYLGSLARALTLFLAEKHVVPRDQVVGEPNLLQWLGDFAGSAKSLPVPPLLFAAGIAADKGMGSDAYAGFKDQALALAGRAQDPASPFFRIAPLLYQIFGEENAYADRCAQLLENGEAALLDWLSALENQPK